MNREQVRQKLTMKETLKDLRKQNQLSRADVAKALSTTISAVSHYENGIRRINIDQVLSLVELYKCSAEEIIQAQINSCQ